MLVVVVVVLVGVVVAVGLLVVGWDNWDCGTQAFKIKVLRNRKAEASDVARKEIRASKRFLTLRVMIFAMIYRWGYGC